MKKICLMILIISSAKGQLIHFVFPIAFLGRTPDLYCLRQTSFADFQYIRE